ncbi:MAG: MFS transporter, partial [Egibacteraceae bacterium]
ITFEGPETEAMVDKQVEMVQTALDKNPDALCLAALDATALIPQLEAAQAAGIPVIGFDSGVDSDIPVATAATDNIAAAALAADKMAELIGGEGKVAVIVHDQTSRTGIDRRDGFVNRIESTYPDIEIVSIQYGGGDHLKSTDLAKAILQANPDLKGFFGANEGSIIGVLNAVTEMDMVGEIVVIDLTPFVVAVGALTLVAFSSWERRRARQGRSRLVRLELLSLAPLRAALQALLTQNVVLLGTFFVVPLYLQLVQGLNALETGLRMLPVSVAMLLTSLGGSLLSSRLSPRAIVRGGFAVLVVALATLIGAIEPALEGWGFGSAMAALGVGMGLIASQLGNVIQSAVDDGDRSEAGGLQWTAQQLGGSLGVAVIGAVVLSALAGNVIAIVEDDARLAPQVREQVTTQVSEGLDFVTVEQVGDAGQEAGLDAASLAAVTEDYAEAQLVALKAGLLAALGLAVLALVLVRDLPSGKARPPVPTS